MRHKKLLLIIFGLLNSVLACTTQEPILVYVTHPTPDTFGAVVIGTSIPTVDVDAVEPTTIVQIPTIDITQVPTLKSVAVTQAQIVTNMASVTATPVTRG